ncbi:glycosyltransferase family 4 protein [Candidatus Peribacteria bacterium]|nr:glycosyltransferase family 4 protein [Candidatus Peribacteria bacterium]
MKKRVVILSAFLSPFRSGAEACAEEVALRLSDEFDITIITAKLRRDLPRNDVLSPSPPQGGGGRGEGVSPVRVIRVGCGFPFDKWLYPFLAPFAARRFKPDVLHAILESFAGLALHACTAIIPGVKQILTLQTTNRGFLRRHILRNPHVITAISTVLADQAATLGRSDVTVIPNGVDFALIRKICDATPKTPGRIMFIGRLEQMKGVDVLLKAYQQLTIQPSNHPTISLHIIGRGSQRQSLEALAQDLGIADTVVFCGYRTGEELHREYAEAEIFCGLSRSEAMGNVFLEAQAAGCAVVATNVGGIPEIVKDGVTGLLVGPDDAAKAADAMTRLLSDADLKMKLASAGIRNAQGYDWDGIAKRYAQLY